MNEIKQTRDNFTLEELLPLFIEVYSLPKFSQQIKDTYSDSHERLEKINELKIKIFNIYELINDENFRDLTSFNITPSSYSREVERLKHKLIDEIIKLYEYKPTFLIIYEINYKLNYEYQNLCDQLNIDMTMRLQDQQKEKALKQLLKDIFYKKFDIDGDGLVSLHNLEKVFTELNLPISMAHELMQKVDVNKDGNINLHDFEQYCEKEILKYYKIFLNLDSDNDNKLDYRQAKHSLHEVFPNLELSDDIYRNLFNTMDQDKSGFITFEEWFNFLFLFPQINLEFMLTQWKLYSLTMMDPQQPANAFLERDIKVKHGNITTSYFEILKIFFCGGISGGLSRTITAPLERLKLLYQTSFTETKPPTLFKGLKDIYSKSGFLSLYKGNTLSIFIAFLEQALRFAIIEYSKTHFQDEYGNIKNKYFLYIGVITGILSTLIIFPFDVVRIRMMSSQENKIRIFKEFQNIYYYFGSPGFYTGLVPHLITVLPSGSLNVFFYNSLKYFFIKDSDFEKPKMSKFMFLGGFAAYITGTITYPFTLLTSRLIVINREVKIYAKRIGFFKITRNTYINEGLNGFFKGYSASMLRLFIAQSINFGTYERLKMKFVNKKNLKKKGS